jgi:hypothetical protein
VTRARVRGSLAFPYGLFCFEVGKKSLHPAIARRDSKRAMCNIEGQLDAALLLEQPSHSDLKFHIVGSELHGLAHAFLSKLKLTSLLKESSETAVV